MIRWLDRLAGFIAGAIVVLTLINNRPKVESLLTAATPIVINKWDSIYTPIRNFSFKGEVLKFTDVVAAQVALETFYYQSKVYKENHNLVGMKHNGRGYSLGTKNGHAYYKSDEDCLKDYAEYQRIYMPYYEKKHGKIRTNEDYIKFLRSQGYAEDDGYKLKLSDLLATVLAVKKAKSNS